MIFDFCCFFFCCHLAFVHSFVCVCALNEWAIRSQLSVNSIKSIVCTRFSLGSKFTCAERALMSQWQSSFGRKFAPRDHKWNYVAYNMSFAGNSNRIVIFCFLLFFIFTSTREKRMKPSPLFGVVHAPKWKWVWHVSRWRQTDTITCSTCQKLIETEKKIWNIKQVLSCCFRFAFIWLLGHITPSLVRQNILFEQFIYFLFLRIAAGNRWSNDLSAQSAENKSRVKMPSIRCQKRLRDFFNYILVAHFEASQLNYGRVFLVSLVCT